MKSLGEFPTDLAAAEAYDAAAAKAGRPPTSLNFGSHAVAPEIAVHARALGASTKRSPDRPLGAAAWHMPPRDPRQYLEAFKNFRQGEPLDASLCVVYACDKGTATGDGERAGTCFCTQDVPRPIAGLLGPGW